MTNIMWRYFLFTASVYISMFKEGGLEVIHRMNTEPSITRNVKSLVDTIVQITEKSKELADRSNEWHFDYKILLESSSVFNTFIFMALSLSLISDIMSPGFEISNTCTALRFRPALQNNTITNGLRWNRTIKYKFCCILWACLILLLHVLPEENIHQQGYFGIYIIWNNDVCVASRLLIQSTRTSLQ